MINFSTFDKEFIEEEATKELTSLLDENYGIKEVEVNKVKSLSI